MPRFRFIVADGRGLAEETAFDLIDVAEAKSQAIRTAGEVLEDIGLGTVWDGAPWRINVLDEQGRDLLEIEFKIKGRFPD